jgi:hypothetical protein
MSKESNDLTILHEIIHENSLLLKGLNERLTSRELTVLLSQLLFEITNRLSVKLVEIRDRKALMENGPFKYSGQVDTLKQEGLMPADVYECLRNAGIDRHIGPSYIRVKSLLTHGLVRKLFGRQMALLIQEYLCNTPLEKPDGQLVCIPNMTGGAWIGDETRRQLEEIGLQNVWPATPYAREMRKVISTKTGSPKIIDYIEGILPTPEMTGSIFCFEELRTASETTSNALGIYRQFGYDEQANVRLVAASLFDYRHPVGVERLRILGVNSLYLVDGRGFFEVSRELGYITIDQYHMAIDWLTDPWDFARRIVAHIS